MFLSEYTLQKAVRYVQQGGEKCPEGHLLMLSDQHLERVTQYKYVGVTITDDLSWSSHVNIISAKARKLTRLLYRQFYHWSSSPTLLKLYTTLVRPHLEYSAPACYKSWDTGYDHLLSQSNLPRMATRRDMFFCTKYS